MNREPTNTSRCVARGGVATTLIALALAGGCGGTITEVGAGSQTASASSSSGSSVTSSAGGTGGSITTGPSSVAASGTSTSSSGGGGAAPASPPTKIDLLLVVDNSSSMADKQQTLALGVQDLVNALLNPACLDSTGTPVPASMQPPPTGACPAGTTRDFPVITDVHIGMLSSSLGTFGADGCPDSSTTGCANNATNTSTNDHGHLVTRTDPCATSVVPTYQSQGFLAWDPNGTLTPPGESSLTNLGTNLTDLVTGDGQIGCGFESQNESWYRFLVDPAPYATIALNSNSQVQTSGTDTALLQQRAEFLRPDSLLAIVNVTDETDVSIKQFSSYPLFAQDSLHLPTASSVCTTKGPADPCCYSCGESPPSGCTADPSCATTPFYTAQTENVAIRAFGLSTGLQSHKARYGIEFFYPPSRYVQALTSTTVVDDSGNTKPNPIFAGGRSPSWVFYAAFVGVPWQLVARQKNGVPDLINGVSALDPTQVGGFKTAAELDLNDPTGHTFWDDIAGTPETYIAPRSPFMQESTAPRSGTDPITGIAISTSPSAQNPINGNEYDIPSPPGDIEYACIFPLLTPVDCSQPGAICDCQEGTVNANNPLCAPNPNDNMKLTLQTSAKAYPGLKHLAIAKGVGKNGIVASLCAKQVSDPTQADYAYEPATRTIVSALKPTLRGH